MLTSVFMPFHAPSLASLRRCIRLFWRIFTHSAWFLTSEPACFMSESATFLSSKFLGNIFHFPKFVLVHVPNLIDILATWLICWNLRYQPLWACSWFLILPRRRNQRWRSLNCISFLLSYSQITVCKSCGNELIVSPISPGEHSACGCNSRRLSLPQCWQQEFFLLFTLWLSHFYVKNLWYLLLK